MMYTIIMAQEHSEPEFDDGSSDVYVDITNLQITEENVRE